MKPLVLAFIIVAMTLVGCTAGFETSHMKDHSNSSTIPNSLLFSSAQEVIYQNCNSCHNGDRAISFQYTTAQEFVAAGLIVPGNPRQSRLIYRLKNYPAEEATNNNMPLGSSRLSDTDYQIIYNWIVEMPSGQSPYQCDSTELRVSDIEESHAKRLSARQYRNTLIDLLTMGLNNSSTATNIADTALSAHPLPGDSSENFSREANIFTGEHALAYLEVANTVAQQVSNSHLSGFLGQILSLNNPENCPTQNVTSLSDSCRDQWIQNMILVAFRRPARTPEQNLSTTTGDTVDELASFRSEFQGTSLREGVNRVLFRLLFAPHFLFQIEDQNLISVFLQNDDVYRLSSFAIINRLSYQFWNTMPDLYLLNLAGQQDLNEPEHYSQAVEHIISRGEKLDDSLREYFNEWLHLEKDLRPFARQDRLALIDSSITFDQNLRQSMIHEVEELGSYITRSGGTFKDIFTTDVSFARNPDLMRIYGMTQAAPANVTSANAIRMSASQRSGLLTRAAMLSSGSEDINHIRRAVNVSHKILCQSFGAPPTDATEIFESISVPHNISSREKVAIRTSSAQCASCHQKMNPLGFAFSNYNSFGGHISEEPIFSPDGSYIQEHVVVNSQVNLSDIFGPGQNANNGMELSRIVASQESTRVCFAEKYMTYSHGRTADRKKDACRLERIYSNLSDEGQLVDMVRAAALDAAFRLRKMTPAQ